MIEMICVPISSFCLGVFYTGKSLITISGKPQSDENISLRNIRLYIIQFHPSGLSSIGV